MRRTGCVILTVFILGTVVQGQEELVGTWQLIDSEPELTARFGEDGEFEMILPAAAVFDEQDMDFSNAGFVVGAVFVLSESWETNADEFTHTGHPERGLGHRHCGCATGELWWSSGGESHPSGWA